MNKCSIVILIQNVKLLNCHIPVLLSDFNLVQIYLNHRNTIFYNYHATGMPTLWRVLPMGRTPPCKRNS